MILPQTYVAALFLMILSMLCWGSWANTYKLVGAWRFELFYFDYVLGVLLAAILIGFTFGMFGFDGLQLTDDLRIAGKRAIAFGGLAGVVFNLANMLLVAAIAVAGLAVAFPVGIGTALVTSVIWNYILRRQGNPVLLFTGAAIIAGAIIADALAYRAHALSKLEHRIRTGKSKSTRRTVSAKAIVLSLASGLLMGSFFPLVDTARQGDPGLGPYSIGVVFAIGVFLSTFVFNLFFMNLPVEGEPVEMFLYLKGDLKRHLLGITGGLISYTGIVTSFAAASVPEKAQVGPAIGYAIGQGAAIIGALWGLLVWKEFAGADPRVRILLGVTLILFVCGLATLYVAPLFATR